MERLKKFVEITLRFHMYMLLGAMVVIVDGLLVLLVYSLYNTFK